jgi:hypothetical protein
LVVSRFFRTFASENLNVMITRQKTLKLIKEKVDSRASGKIKLKKQFTCEFVEGTFKHTERRRIVSLIKQGNSVMWIDDAYAMRNINVLDTKDLHKIMWQNLSDKEKREIALEHLLESKTYLED